jgi:hypothetical protein
VTPERRAELNEEAFYGDAEYWAEHGALHLAMAEGNWPEVERIEKESHEETRA